MNKLKTKNNILILESSMSIKNKLDIMRNILKDHDIELMEKALHELC